jgi:hypothetical protein
MTPLLTVDRGQYQNVDPKIRNWFNSVRSPNGVSCCDTSDGHYTIWRKSEFEGHEYDVPIEGIWTPVPPEAVVRNSNNPTGETIVWYVKQDGIQPWHIRCFVLGNSV